LRPNGEGKAERKIIIGGTWNQKGIAATLKHRIRKNNTHAGTTVLQRQHATCKDNTCPLPPTNRRAAGVGFCARERDPSFGHRLGHDSRKN
jgi:hypothetical protein